MAARMPRRVSRALMKDMLSRSRAKTACMTSAAWNDEIDEVFFF